MFRPLSIKFGNRTLAHDTEVLLNPGSLITFAPKWTAAELHEIIAAERFPGGNVFVVQTPSESTSDLPALTFEFDSGTNVQLGGDFYTAKVSE